MYSAICLVVVYAISVLFFSGFYARRDYVCPVLTALVWPFAMIYEYGYSYGDDDYYDAGP